MAKKFVRTLVWSLAGLFGVVAAWASLGINIGSTFETRALDLAMHRRCPGSETAADFDIEALGNNTGAAGYSAREMKGQRVVLELRERGGSYSVWIATPDKNPGGDECVNLEFVARDPANRGQAWYAHFLKCEADPITNPCTKADERVLSLLRKTYRTTTTKAA